MLPDGGRESVPIDEFFEPQNFGVREFIPAFFAFAMNSVRSIFSVTKTNNRDKESGDESPHSKGGDISIWSAGIHSRFLCLGDEL